MNALRMCTLLLAIVALSAIAALADEVLPGAPTQYVTDTQNVLSQSTVAGLDTELRDYEQTTGHQVIVWIGGTTGDTQLEQWTVDAAEKWGIGRKGHDDGAVLFVFIQDRTIRIEVGYGLEGQLTDAQSSQIIQNVITPRMRTGDYDGAIQAGVDTMLVTITPSFASHIGHEVAQPQDEENTSSSGNPIGFLVFFAAIFFFIMLFSYAGRRSGWITAGLIGSTFYGGGWGGGGSSGGGFGDFSGGGGGFGGGGASGSW